MSYGQTVEELRQETERIIKETESIRHRTAMIRANTRKAWITAGVTAAAVYTFSKIYKGKGVFPIAIGAAAAAAFTVLQTRTS